MEAIIQHGAVPTTKFVDEPDLLLQSLTIAPQRTEGRYRGPNKATQVLTYSDPVTDLQFSGIIKNVSRLADRGPGAAVWALANYALETHGFDPADGMMIYRDPSRSLTSDETPDSVDFTVSHLPFVAKPFPAPFMRVTGTLTSDGTDPLVVPLMAYTGFGSGRPPYAATLGPPATPGTLEVSIVWNSMDEKWVFQFEFIDGDAGAWESSSNVASPELASGWTPVSGGTNTGTPVFSAVYEAP